MNRNYVVAGIVALSLLAVSPIARAEGDRSGDNAEGVQQSTEYRSATGTMMQGDDRESNDSEYENATSSREGEKKAQEQAREQEKKVQEQEWEQEKKAEEHRSKVSEIVHKLLEVADSEDDIGDDLREVSHEQASSSEEAAKAIDGLERESGVKKFFFGPDYRNLGDLRSALVTTQNSIDRLSAARERAVSSTTQAELDAQIQALKDVSSTTQAYVEAHENVFSLLGWFVRLFQK